MQTPPISSKMALRMGKMLEALTTPGRRETQRGKKGEWIFYSRWTSEQNSEGAAPVQSNKTNAVRTPACSHISNSLASRTTRPQETKCQLNASKRPPLRCKQSTSFLFFTSCMLRRTCSVSSTRKKWLQGNWVQSRTPPTPYLGAQWMEGFYRLRELGICGPSLACTNLPLVPSCLYSLYNSHIYVYFCDRNLIF